VFWIVVTAFAWLILPRINDDPVAANVSASDTTTVIATAVVTVRARCHLERPVMSCSNRLDRRVDSACPVGDYSVRDQGIP
jgi:hypothetical protein